ncbi:hypothetical protein AWB92_26725 [Mycobacterium sp. IEC1808]|uniref:hypothetical protein n=1 Tax=Mycobacterium sp. IEC1808 TaxID=1743230 RepID=UPI000A15B305|nr:hypothetical protein [Mycobacterium sp. IEC1808]ORW85974.1 hypothetical protein AWB92_26725 [Mycobacterium sp. IEC1808]
MAQEVDLTEQLKSVASQVLSGDQLAAFMAVADANRCAGPDGNIDADKVSADLRTLYGISEQPPAQPRAPQWGQHSGPPGPPARPGDTARAALAKRHGVKNDTNPPASTQSARGAAGRAAAQRRHGGKQR